MALTRDQLAGHVLVALDAVPAAQWWRDLGVTVGLVRIFAAYARTADAEGREAMRAMLRQLYAKSSSGAQGDPGEVVAQWWEAAGASRREYIREGVA